MAVTNYKPNPQQSLYEYYFKKLALIHQMQIPLSGSDQVNLIMGGITNAHIKFSVETAEISDPAILTQRLKMLESE